MPKRRREKVEFSVNVDTLAMNAIQTAGALGIFPFAQETTHLRSNVMSEFNESFFDDILGTLFKQSQKTDRTQYTILFGCALKFTDSAADCTGGRSCKHFDQCQKTALREGWMGWNGRKI